MLKELDLCNQGGGKLFATLTGNRDIQTLLLFTFHFACLKDHPFEDISLGFYGSSGCVGGLAKSNLLSDRQSKAPQRRSIGQTSRRKRRQWSTSPETMDNNVSISHSLDTHLSSGPPTQIDENKSTDESVPAVPFVNHAAISWHERRREWVGDQSQRTHRPTKEPVISWCTTYEDLLSNNQPFVQPIPLSEMVDFLVDIWQEEGLYD